MLAIILTLIDRIKKVIITLEKCHLEVKDKTTLSLLKIDPSVSKLKFIMNGQSYF